jgi:hypothetical protein
MTKQRAIGYSSGFTQERESSISRLLVRGWLQAREGWRAERQTLGDRVGSSEQRPLIMPLSLCSVWHRKSKADRDDAVKVWDNHRTRMVPLPARGYIPVLSLLLRSVQWDWRDPIVWSMKKHNPFIHLHHAWKRQSQNCYDLLINNGAIKWHITLISSCKIGL